jgi:prophage DNA circulation protein
METIKLSDLQNATIPLVLIEGGEGLPSLEAKAYSNRLTRTAQEQLSEVLLQHQARHENLQNEIRALSEEGLGLDQSEAIAEKSEELAAAERDGADTKAVAKIKRELAALVKAQNEAEGRGRELSARITALADEVEEEKYQSFCSKLAFFIQSTNVVNDSGKALGAEASFWRENFDIQTIDSFLGKLAEVLAGPLGQRQSRQKDSGVSLIS